MSNKIAVLSDLHLGQNGGDRAGQYSLLSYRVKDNLIERLAAELHGFAGSDRLTLVVAGDLCDLALATMRDALDDLAQLVQRLGCLGELSLVVGNHDHHLWCMHSEEERVLSHLRAGQLPQPGGVYHSTGPAGEPMPLLARLLDPVQVSIAYPQHELAVAGGTQILAFTHGHLSGGLYTLLSDLLEGHLRERAHGRVAATVDAPLTELIYWMLGEIGEGLGADGLVEAIYTDLQRGEEGRLRPLVGRLVDQALPDGIVPGIPDRLERSFVARHASAKIAEAVAGLDPAGGSRDRHRGIAGTRANIRDWIERTRLHERRPPVTHIFYGHSHDADEWQVPETGITAINLGSWLREPGRDRVDSNLVLIEDGAGAVRITTLAIR